MSRIKGFIFDMDGVLTDTEHVWSIAFQELCESHGGTFTHEKKMAMIGMNTAEWSKYATDQMGVQLPPIEIASAMQDRVLALLGEHLPQIPGSVEAVKRMSESFKVAIASSTALRIIEGTVRLLGVGDLLTAVVSSDDVSKGKPSPDVYLEAAHRLGLEPSECAAIEDSTNGMRSAHAAGVATLGFPHADFPPEADALALCDRVLRSMSELTVDLVKGLH